MSLITFTCPECGGNLEVDGQGAGLEVNCPFCQRRITIPSTVKATSPTVPMMPPPRPTNPVAAPSKGAGTTIAEKGLFTFARIFAAVLSVILVIGIGIAVLAIFLVGRGNTHVSYREVKNVLNPPQDEPFLPARESDPKVAIPANVEKYFKGENRRVLAGWLKDLDADQKKDFLSNLSIVIAEAEKKSDDVIETVNAYAKLKLSRLRGSEIEKYAVPIARATLVGAIISMMVLLALLSLILVLLAIERNTRRIF